MPTNLLPEQVKRPQGQRSDAVDVALIDLGITRLLDVLVAIDNGTDAGCVMSWIRDFQNTDMPIPAEQTGEVIQKIYREIACVQAQLTSARRKIAAS